MFTASKSSFDIREIIDNKKILLVKLDKGKLKDSADLLGLLLMVKTVIDFRPKFWSYSEEWEHKIEELQRLPLITCYIKHKIEGGLIHLQTVELPPVWESL